MASESTTHRIRRRGRGIPAAASALFAAALCAMTFAVATPALADDPSGGTRILECRSGIVTQNDVSMSSLTVARVPTAELPANTPGDCSVR